MRPLPGHQAIASARAAMNRAKVAHDAVHALDPRIASKESTGAWPDGTDALVAEIALAWPDRDRPDLPFDARVTALRDALVPDARTQHDLEHALEQLLFDQYHGPLQDPEWADVKAILEPLYAERAAMFESLANEYHAVQQRRAAHAQVAGLRAIYDAALPVDAAADVLQAIVDSATSIAAAFDVSPPGAPTLGAPPTAEALASALAAFDAWVAEEVASTDSLATRVDERLARWNEINRQIESLTG